MLVLYIVVAKILYELCLAIYRIFFHPLARFPGSTLAKATFWHETYYDAFKGHQYVWKIKEMHEKYGPVIRTNPEGNIRELVSLVL